jgi:hypothetical protein
MATGDTNDVLARLKSVVPAWFPQSSPILDGVLSGFAQVGSWAYGLLQYTKAQTRIKTASDGFLDIALLDYFGNRIRRKLSQQDAVIRAEIPAEVLRERGTRAGMLKALLDLTGSPATIFEPGYAYDTGGYDSYSLAFDTNGGWGTYSLPYQMFITVVQPTGAGVPNVAGWDTTFGAWDGGYSCFIDQSAITGTVTDQDIYDTIEATRAAGVTAWVNIGTLPHKHGRLGIDFILGSTQLG